MGQNWAIAIGINQYYNLQDLQYAKRDAEAMQAWFEGEAKFNQVFLFTEDSKPIPADPQPIPSHPTFANFYGFLEELFEEPFLNPEDNLWFFFAGHGRRYRDQDYLMFLDSNPRAVDRTAISVDYVTQRLRRSGADNVVLFIDACRNEGSRDGLGIGQQKHKGVITFYSCTADQKAWEIDELQHGSFTYTLLEGLRLQGETNCATVERLDQYLSYHVPQLNHRYSKPLQHPYLKVEPHRKIYYILLHKVASLQDAQPLKYQASLAENRGDWLLAKQLWKRVLALPGVDEDAWEAIERISLRQRQSSPQAKPQPEIFPTEATSSRGEGKITVEPPAAPETKPQIFLFDVVTVNAKGEEIKREQGEAEYFTEDLGNGVTLDMVYIPGGTFMMGSPAGEGYDDEKPQHQVTVQPLCMGKFPVTQAQWKAVAALPKVNRDLKAEPSDFKGDNRPVERVSWYDAVEFCARLSKHTGWEYRLPSEAEWEYACRAGTTTPFYFGETITGKLANYRASKTFADEPEGEYREETTPVGQFPPNAFGLYDMHGNVWEWCLDDSHDNYKGAPTDGSPWFNNNDNLYQKSGRALLRAGSWISLPKNCRSACRLYDLRAERDSFNHTCGFRVVCAFGRTFH
ncbi:MAG: SUMF1/EgtB/PvdO family nonheme iron enzyme [Nostocaceae cyanobacterium]|nr:SUMF1/EgtB/PvdO family nonheme iron enzyme [Nostocaceae cyanobacterium]